MRARVMPARGGQRSEAMGRDSIWKLIYQFSGPSVVSQMVFSSYNLVDAIFMGRLGPEAVAAMAVSTPIIMLTMAIAMGTGVGAASLIGRYLGAGKKDEADRVAAVSITISTLVSALITIIYFMNVDRLLGLFGASGSIVPLARIYVSIIMASTAISKLSVVLSSIVRAEGNPMLSSAAQIVSALFNIITDPIFILGWGVIPRFGIAGAAGTTVASWVLAVLVYVVYFISGKSSFHFKPSYFIPRFRIIREIYRVGIASIVRATAGSTAQTMGNRIAVSFEVVTLAVKGILMRASSFAFMPTMGIGMGVLPLAAYNFGAKQNGRVGESVIKSSLVGFIWGAICFVFVMLFPRQLMAIFSNDPAFLDEGARAIRIFSLAFFTIGVQMILSHYFQATGEGIAALLTASSRQIIFLLPLTYIIPSLFGVVGLWLVFPVADVLSIIITVTWASISFKKHSIILTWHARIEAVTSPVVIP